MSTAATHVARLRKAIMPIACGATLLIPVGVWFLSVGNPSQYWTGYVPPGQTLFALSKLSALLAIALLWYQAMTALARFSPVLKGFLHLGRRGHVILGSITFALIVAHVTLFIAASTMRTGHLALSPLIPAFNNGYYAAYTGVGAIALWLCLVMVIAGVARSRGYVGWTWLHRSFAVVFTMAFLHGIAIGSETRFGLMAYVYAFLALSLLMAIGSSVWNALAGPLRRRSSECGVGIGPCEASRSND